MGKYYAFLAKGKEPVKMRKGHIINERKSLTAKGELIQEHRGGLAFHICAHD